MRLVARRLRLALTALGRALLADTMAIMDSLKTGSWTQHKYHILDAAREKSRRRTLTITGLLVTIILFFWYSAPGSPSPANLRAYTKQLCDHPVVQLVRDASIEFNQTVERQSTSLEEAVTEYRRRYGMPPPPHFDKWYEFAKERNATMIDEYDTIHHSILPFWGLAPSIIRSRVTEDLGFDTHTMGVSIRNGIPFHLGNSMGPWQIDATMESLSLFAQWLPDMYLEFNIHDEPRVNVLHEDLSRMVAKGLEAQARLNGQSVLYDVLLPSEYEDPIPEVATDRFINIEKQETWLYSRLSCPPDSPVKDINGNATDNSTSYAMGPLGFVFNQTAATDFCLSPSLRRRIGLFDRPNAFKLTNELVPMFSMSHPSSFQDIAVPSPYYYEKITDFDENTAVPWDLKKGQLYWRGGSSGGISHGGSWRNYQRQFVVSKLMHNESPRYVLDQNQDSACYLGREEAWKVRKANHTELDGYFNTFFTGIDDCEEDCYEENMYFEVVDREEQSEAWKHKYLLDMDGHAYSGRFYAFLRSASVPFKLTMFREWHDNVLKPWVHYVPINKEANEIPELIRFFEKDPVGQDIARSIGMEGQAWAAKALRNDDMDVYFFRLLLE